jgi:hypothetical protein
MNIHITDLRNHGYHSRHNENVCVVKCYSFKTKTGVGIM